MLSQLFSKFGARLGKAYGGGILSSVGRYAGRLLGSYLDNLNYEPEEYYKFNNIRDSFSLSTATYGQAIPLIFGSACVSAKIIWASQIKEIQRHSVEEEYFKEPKYLNISRIKTIRNIIDCEYYVSLALCLCEGEITEIARCWANGQPFDLKNYNFRLYKGCEEQLPDPLLGSAAPAFRGLAYIVFEDLPLKDFNNCLPDFSFEVVRKASKVILNSFQDLRNNNALLPHETLKQVQGEGFLATENLIKSIVVIPGSGEFVYDTVIQYKITHNQDNAEIYEKAVNSHNYYNIADGIHSLNQLQITCPNLEWVALTVCWFADSLDIGECIIQPRIEFNDPLTNYSEDWQVASYTRSTARLISRDVKGNPNYGGSVNDASLLRYLQELKSRNLKIMFYPIVLLDIHGKPWRGRLSGEAKAVEDFFNKPEGYNEFIIHYAKLVGDYADSFIIGSELIGLTKICDYDNFPAVNELINLAGTVKRIMGAGVEITYAADWSEYHHTEGGWYNLDPLWACEYIDFVGIDAYFPITRTTDSIISEKELSTGWQSGNGYDYYIDNGIKISLAPEYAWKNLRYWWENRHRNPDGQITSWQPKMKKICFTEFGFPSIDKASNQPNVFFDPFCVDGGTPLYSSGQVDFALQCSCIRAFIEYWQTQEYIERMFLWCWDARPYPAWPHMDIWKDSYLWEKGHWVNNKFGSAPLAAIITELSDRCGIDINLIKVESLNEIVAGIIFDRQMSVIDAINILRIAYFFDIEASEADSIKFIKRGSAIAEIIDNRNLIKLSSDNFIEEIVITSENIINTVHLYFINRRNDYQNNYCLINGENSSNQSAAIIKLPLLLSGSQAERLGRLILKNAADEDRIIRFSLPANNIQYQPTDFIVLDYNQQSHNLRITEIKLSRLTLEFTAVVDDGRWYNTHSTLPLNAQPLD